MNSYTQGPREKVHYKQVITGDTLVSADWSIDPLGPTIQKLTTSADSTVCSVSGLRTGVSYKLTCHLVCASGQEFDPSAVIRCK